MMNEHQPIAPRGSALDELLQEVGAEGATMTLDEYQQIDMLTQQLASTELSADSQMQQVLRRRLLNQIDTRHRLNRSSQGGLTMHNRRFSGVRRLAIGAALAVAISGVAVQVPAVQAVAQRLWHQVGDLVITNEPTAAERAAANTPIMSATPQPGAGTSGAVAAAPTPTPLPAASNVEELTAQQAQTKYGFALYQPSYVPNDYSLFQQQINAHQPGGTVAAATVYDGPPAQQPTYLSIQQSIISAGQPHPFAVGDAEVVDVTVRGVQGTWITQAKVATVDDGQGGNTVLPISYLMWEEDGYFFTLDSSSLSREEMLKVAESLTQ